MSTGSKPLAGVVPPSSVGMGAREPQLFRFRLRQLFLLVSATAGLCTLLATTRGPWPWIIAFFAALVAAHIAGNFLGTRLRDTSGDVRRWRSKHGGTGPDDPQATPQPVRWAELSLPGPTPLALHEPAPLPLPGLWLVIAGAAASAVGGTVALVLLTGERAGWPAIALGAMSCGVIGAWFALAASSFWGIARQAWRHAQGKAAAGGAVAHEPRRQ